MHARIGSHHRRRPPPTSATQPQGSKPVPSRRERRRERRRRPTKLRLSPGRPRGRGSQGISPYRRLQGGERRPQASPSTRPTRDFARTRSPPLAAPPVQNRQSKEVRPDQASPHTEQGGRGGARSRAPATAKAVAGCQRPPDPPPARLLTCRASPMEPPLQIRDSACRGRAA
ncbi:hypothetical protein D1007_53486 [Hordeum vulgare]|nr:hypothetical protein D1007_53486 [Hordeum vulgare]